MNPIFDDISNNQFRFVYAANPGSGNTVQTHSMESLPNARTSDAAWKIKEFTYDASDNMTAVKFPQGSNGNASSDFAFIADNYASYTYGPA